MKNLKNSPNNYLLYSFFAEPESLLKADSCVSDTDNGVDIENDDDLPMDGDGMDHDPNDMNRPRKIRR